MNEFPAAIDAMQQPSLPTFRSAAPQLVRNGSILRFYATMLAPRYDELAKRHYESLAARRLAACSLAIRWYQCDHHGRVPAGLDALVPEYLPAVPLDPLAADDRPLTYAPHEPRPRIYSVGGDGQDDVGEPDGLEPSPLVSRREKDLIADLRRPPRYDGERDHEHIVEDLSAWNPK